MTLSDPAAITAATHPVRAAILDAMREPSTAAAVARVVGQSRQNVAYHVRAAALADQLSLGELFAAGERLQRDSAVLLDRAAFDGDEVPSASVTTDIRFVSEEARSAFLHDSVDALTALAHQHGSRRGAPYRLLLAAYPNPEDA